MNRLAIKVLLVITAAYVHKKDRVRGHFVTFIHSKKISDKEKGVDEVEQRAKEKCPDDQSRTLLYGSQVKLT